MHSYDLLFVDLHTGFGELRNAPSLKSQFMGLEKMQPAGPWLGSVELQSHMRV